MMSVVAGLFGFLALIAFVLLLAALLASPVLFFRYRKMQRNEASLEARMLLQITSH